MATNKFEFIKLELFVSKEHYLAFRQGWKDFINSGKAKPVFTDHPYCGRVKDSPLTAEHHLLFNILTEKDLSKTFKPSENRETYGFENALTGLKMYGRKALEVVLYETGEYEKPSYMTPDKYAKMMKGNRIMVEEFLEPFGKAVTLEMLATLYSDYLRDKKLTNRPTNPIEKAA